RAIVVPGGVVRVLRHVHRPRLVEANPLDRRVDVDGRYLEPDRQADVRDRRGRRAGRGGGGRRRGRAWGRGGRRRRRGGCGRRRGGGRGGGRLVVAAAGGQQRRRADQQGQEGARASGHRCVLPRRPRAPSGGWLGSCPAIPA